MNVQKSSIGIGALTAIASSLCCIGPLIALVAGTTSMASTFSWIEPFRPWLIGFTLLALGIAWYPILKPASKKDCDCEDQQIPFFQKKSFLALVSVFALLMLALPSYAQLFFPAPDKASVEVMEERPITEAQFEVYGMTCSGCEGHVEQAVNNLKGIIEVKASFKNRNTTVKFDSVQTNLAEIERALKTTNYKVGGAKIID